jgi:hypothetical protein
MRFGVLLALPLLLCACPSSPPPIGGDEDDAGPAADGLAASDYCETIVDFFCPYYLRCGRMAVDDVAQCRAVFLEACNARYEPSFVSLADAGLLVLDADGVAACRDHLEDVPCEEQLLDLDGPCSTMWRGTQAVGEACGFDVESFTCAPGAACVLDLTLCGTCERVVDDGQRCDTEGVTCARDSECKDGVCTARKKVGEACTANDRCVLGATCVLDGAAGTCQGPAYVGVGDACDFDNRCPYASSCRGGVCTASAELGQSCDDATACDSGFCGEDGSCVALVAQGGACSESAECQTGVCIEGRCSSLPSACLTATTSPSAGP